jgi:hypothetical protein
VLQNIRDAAADFWQAVATKTPPEFDFSKDGKRIAALYDTPIEGVIDLSKDNRIAAALDDLLETKAAIKELSERERRSRQKSWQNLQAMSRHTFRATA